MKVSNTMWVIILILTYVLLYFIFRTTEGFLAIMPGDHCGVDIKACPSNRKCMNGVCYSTNKPCLPNNELDIVY